MSTRATIKIVKNDCNSETLYHHYDGYPEGVGNELDMFLKKIYSNNEKVDTPTQLAQLINEYDNSYQLNETQHGDEEFAYLINMPDYTITCYALDFDEFDWKDDKIVYVHNISHDIDKIRQYVMDAISFEFNTDKPELIAKHNQSIVNVALCAVEMALNDKE